MFVWIFHRVSGIILIVLLGVKIVSGYGVLGRFGDPVIEGMRLLHKNVAVDLLFLGFFIYHALYGIRTCLIDLGLKYEKALFWFCTVLGTVLFLCISWTMILGL